jgi:glutamyl-tRNA synthetase
MMRMPPAELAEAVFARFDAAGLKAASADDLTGAVTLFRERANTLVELTEALRPYFSEFDEYDAAAAKKHLRPVAAEPLSAVREQLAALSDWSPAPLHHVVEQTAESLGLGMGKVGMPLRVAVTGSGQSPGLGETLELIGRERALERIDRALEFIATRASADSA